MSHYLSLMQKVLTRELWIDDPAALAARQEGKDWPTAETDAETMVGSKRLKNVCDLCSSALFERTPGDFMDCGVWRGGCGIMMAAVLKDKAVNSSQRCVWVADSFQGCPQPSPELYPADAGDRHHELTFLQVPVEQVKKNFFRYSLGVYPRILSGWFKDSLPGFKYPLAVLRIDGDLYESTWQCLEHLYPSVSKGGFVIVDDYGCVAGCRQAVDDYRAKHSITNPLVKIDWTGVYWSV